MPLMRLPRSDLDAWEAALAELDPPEFDVFGALGYTPTPKQRLFHDATEFDVLFGGSLGGGKTKALVVDGIATCVKYPGIRVGCFRKSYPELRDTIVYELGQMGFAQSVGAKWNGTEYELKFSNGSLLMCRYAENMQDALRRQGAQYQKVMFDERTQLIPDVTAYIESRIRSGRRDIPVLGIRSTANPGGPSHGAVRARYIDGTGHGERTYTDEAGRTVRFIPSTMRDNPHLDAAYEQRLLALPEKMRKALREGDWGAFAGQMFTELTHARHVMTPVSLPDSWLRYNGIDWGHSNPWAVVWGAVDEDGRVWIYREIYQTQVGEADQARRILEAETDGEQVVARFADDAMWATRGDAKPIADVYADNGVYLTPAGKGAGSRVNGWQRVRSYLSEGPACRHHREQGWQTCPRLHIFSTCENLYRELRDLPHATKGDPEDADTTASDHACDGLRYMLVNLGAGPQFYLEPERTGPPPLEGMPDRLPQPLGPRIALMDGTDPATPWATVNEQYPPARGQVVIVNR